MTLCQHSLYTSTQFANLVSMYNLFFWRTTEVLGSGHFGTVSKGVWQSKLGSVDVAVKMLRPEASEFDEVRFLQEAAINGQFKHPNIVTLLGVVTVGMPAMIVLELLPNGDLRNYLSRFFRAGESPSANTSEMLLGFCKQIASGMEYLSSKAFVHRDLAARNILVAKDQTCKVWNTMAEGQSPSVPGVSLKEPLCLRVLAQLIRICTS